MKFVCPERAGRSWAISMRVHGVQRRFTLADSTEMSSRRRASLRAGVRVTVRNGADPTERRRVSRQAAARTAAKAVRSAEPMKAVLDQFEQAVAFRRCKSRGRPTETHRGRVPQRLPATAAELRAEDVRQGASDAAEARVPCKRPAWIPLPSQAADVGGTARDRRVPIQRLSSAVMSFRHGTARGTAGSRSIGGGASRRMDGTRWPAGLALCDDLQIDLAHRAEAQRGLDHALDRS